MRIQRPLYCLCGWAYCYRYVISNRMSQTVRHLPKEAFTSRAIRRVRFSHGSISYIPYMPVGVAVVVSKKIDKRAVARNRIRRRVYSVLRDVNKSTPLRESFIVFPTRTALTAPYAELKNAIEKNIRH
jgi:RNase P protein component